MSIQNEIIQLIGKSNHEYLITFLTFSKTQLSELKYSELKSIVELFEKTSVPSTPTTTPSTKQCTHIFKRGNNIGKQCNVILKDGEHIFCSKHRTIEANQKIEQALKLSKLNEETLQSDLVKIASEDEDEEDKEDDLEDGDKIIEVDDDKEDEEDKDEEDSNRNKKIKVEKTVLDPYIMDPEDNTELEDDYVEDVEEDDIEEDDNDDEDEEDW